MAIYIIINPEYSTLTLKTVPRVFLMYMCIFSIESINADVAMHNAEGRILYFCAMRTDVRMLELEWVLVAFHLPIFLECVLIKCHLNADIIRLYTTTCERFSASTYEIICTYILFIKIKIKELVKSYELVWSRFPAMVGWLFSFFKSLNYQGANEQWYGVWRMWSVSDMLIVCSGKSSSKHCWLTLLTLAASFQEHSQCQISQAVWGGDDPPNP